jgi:hypothetical protein
MRMTDDLKRFFQNVKYFSPMEFYCNCGCKHVRFNKELILMLDYCRILLGQPVIINSATRCPALNAEVGGSPTSSHLQGFAVDIAATTGYYKYDLVAQLYRAGFNRIGIGPAFIHADIDHDKPQGVLWTY